MNRRPPRPARWLEALAGSMAIHGLLLLLPVPVRGEHPRPPGRSEPIAVRRLEAPRRPEARATAAADTTAADRPSPRADVRATARAPADEGPNPAEAPAPRPPEKRARPEPAPPRAAPATFVRLDGADEAVPPSRAQAIADRDRSADHVRRRPVRTPRIGTPREEHEERTSRRTAPPSRSLPVRRDPSAAPAGGDASRAPAPDAPAGGDGGAARAAPSRRPEAAAEGAHPPSRPGRAPSPAASPAAPADPPPAPGGLLPTAAHPSAPRLPSADGGQGGRDAPGGKEPAPASARLASDTTPPPTGAHAAGGASAGRGPAPGEGAAPGARDALPWAPSRAADGGGAADRPEVLPEDVPIDIETAISARATPLGRYAARVDAVLRERWSVPLGARTAGLQGVTTVAFTVDRRGRVTGLHVVRSSGYPALDRAALGAVPALLPPPPRPLRDRPITFQMTFRVRNPVVGP